MHKRLLQKRTFKNLIHVGLITCSLFSAGVMRAQSDLDIIQAIATKDPNKVAIYLKRGIDPNALYGPTKKTALMMAVEQCDEIIKNNEKHKNYSLATNMSQFAAGTGVFVAGAYTAAISASMLAGLYNDPSDKKQAAKQTTNPLELPEAEAPQPTYGWYNPLRWYYGSSTQEAATPAANPEVNADQQKDSSAPMAGSGLGGKEAAEAQTDPVAQATPSQSGQAGFVDSMQTARELRKTLSNINKGTLPDIQRTLQDLNTTLKETRAVFKIIGTAVLVAGCTVGGFFAYRGGSKGVDGIIKVAKTPIQNMYYNYELGTLKRIIYLLLHQEHINLSVKNGNGETVLDMVHGLMLSYKTSKKDYCYLAEIEQLIKTRQMAS